MDLLVLIIISIAMPVGLFMLIKYFLSYDDKLTIYDNDEEE